MRKVLASILVTVFLAIGSAAYALPTVINFDGLGSLEAITNQYAADGINFENAVALTSWNYSFAPMRYTGNVVAYSGSSSSSTFLFDQDVTYFTLLVTASNYSLSLNMYDGANSLIRTYSSYISQGIWHSMTPDLTGVNVRKIVLSGNADQFGYDEITYNLGNSVVPEPATLLLLGSGLLGLVGIRKRRSS